MEKIDKDTIDFKWGYLQGALTTMIKIFPPNKMSITKEELDSAIKMITGEI